MTWIPHRVGTLARRIICFSLPATQERDHSRMDRVRRLARSSGRWTIIRRLTIGQLMALLAFLLQAAPGADLRPLAPVRPIRLPLIKGEGIRFTHLSTEEGLSESRVESMLQDRRLSTRIQPWRPTKNHNR
jgi:hypothetical protein